MKSEVMYRLEELRLEASQFGLNDILANLTFPGVIAVEQISD